jgi:hypothetical protein
MRQLDACDIYILFAFGITFIPLLLILILGLILNILDYLKKIWK